MTNLLQRGSDGPRRARPAPWQPLPSPGMKPMLHGLIGAGFALSVVAAVDAAITDRWTGTGMAFSAEGAIGVDVDGHDYAVPQDVAWTDLQGDYHEGGRPECLPPSGKLEGPIRITAQSVEAAGYKRRQVVHVECLGATQR